MSQNKICPVCKRTSNSDGLRCEHCGTEAAFCTLFSGETAYNEWLKLINLKKGEIFGSLSSELPKNGSRLSVSLDNIVFCNNKTNKAIVLRFGLTTPTVYENIRQVALSRLYTVFLRTDGTVFAEGDDEYGQCRLSDLKNIVYIASSPRCTYAVSSDGTVTPRGITAFGDTISAWTDIKSVACTNECIVGLKADGTVCAAAVKDSRIEKYVSAVNSWNNVIKVDIGDKYIVALTNNGQILYSGEDDRKSDCTRFVNCIDIAADDSYVIGLSADGRVHLAGTPSKYSDYNRIEAAKWENMYFISCAYGKQIIAGLTASGELKIIGNVTDSKEISSAFSPSYRNSVTE